MRSMFAIALALSAGCAGMNASGSGTAQNEGCAPATTNKAAVVYSNPDSASRQVATLKSASQVCADPEATAFGYRHVKLGDGREGYVEQGDLI